MGIAGLAGCTKSGSPSAVATTTTTEAPTTTVPGAVSNLIVVGVRPGVLQNPFYPQITVNSVTCGPYASGGRYVRIDLPIGKSGTPAGSVMTKPTAVIVVPGAALLIDARFPHRTLYSEGMKSISTTQGSFVLTLTNDIATGGDGLTVVPGAVQINGDYQCPATDLPYPGT